MSQNNINLYHSQLPTIATVGKITLTKPRLHNNRGSDLNFLIYVVKGTFYVCEDDIEYEVNKGEIFFLKGGVPHHGTHYMATGTVWYWVSFQTTQSDEMKVDTPKSKDSTLLPKKTTFNDQQWLYQNFDDMYLRFRSSNPYKLPHIAAHLTSILYTILASPTNYHSGNETIVKKVNELLALQVHDKFDSSIIASKMNLDYSYIGKCYKAQTGSTINHQFNCLKVEASIKYMEEGTMNITQISEVLNYPNPYYFSRVFKRITNQSPSEFIKQMYYDYM